VTRIGESGDLLKCSFCGKTQKQVKKLIAGPGVYICDECIDLCNEIIEDELSEATSAGLQELPKPQEIYDFLDQYVIGQDRAKKSLSTSESNQGIVIAKMASNFQRAISCFLAQQVAVRHFSPRLWLACSMFHLRLLTQQLSPKQVMSVKM
jgi:hypothetical protein